MKIEVLVAAMHQENTTLVDKMKLNVDTIIANQHNGWGYTEDMHNGHRVRMVTTDTVGVGINRNIGLEIAEGDILVLSDDDMIYYDSDLSGVRKAFEKHPDADLIFFGLDYSRNGEITERRRCKDKKAYLFNSLKFGCCRMAIRRSALVKHRLKFSTMFGGGSSYGSGEDSILICDCFKAGMKAYTDSYVLGVCSKDESSWFSGYNDKYLFDKGAWIAASFPKSKCIIKWYFIYKFSKKAEKSLLQTAKLVNRGIKAYRTFETYPEGK